MDKQQRYCGRRLDDILAKGILANSIYRGSLRTATIKKQLSACPQVLQQSVTTPDKYPRPK